MELHWGSEDLDKRIVQIVTELRLIKMDQEKVPSNEPDFGAKRSVEDRVGTKLVCALVKLGDPCGDWFSFSFPSTHTKRELLF